MVNLDILHQNIKYQSVSTDQIEKLFKEWTTVDVCEDVVQQLGGDKLQCRDINISEDSNWNPAHMVSFPFTISFDKLKQSMDKESSDVQRELITSHLLAKGMPAMDSTDVREIIRGTLKKDGLFPAYVLEDINYYLHKANVEEIVYPRVHFRRLTDNDNELIITDDVCFDGYMLHNYREAMTKQQAIAVIETYARLHAGFYLFEQAKGPAVKYCAEMIEHPMDKSDRQYKFLEKSVEGLLESHIAVLGNNLEYKSLRDAIKKRNNHALKTFMDKFETTKLYKVFSHGSIGANLIYFNDDNKVCLTDFGGSRLASPAADLNNLYFTCLNSDQRRDWMEELTDLYYKKFEDVVRAGRRPVPFSKEELRKEVKEKLWTGWFAGINSLVGYLGGRQYCSNLKLFTPDNLELFTADNKLKIKDLFDRDSVFRKRFVDMYKDLVAYKSI